MSIEFTDKAEVLLSLEKLKLFYSFQNELLSFHLSVFYKNSLSKHQLLIFKRSKF